MNLIVHDDATLIAIGEWSTPLMFGLLGVVLIVILEAKKIRGAILIGILATTLAAILTGQVAPPEAIFSTPPSLSPVAFQLDRSEEHTSELQSRGHLVCRLLLEKKKANK